jgi:hypothetical protein
MRAPHCQEDGRGGNPVVPSSSVALNPRGDEPFQPTPTEQGRGPKHKSLLEGIFAVRFSKQPAYSVLSFDEANAIKELRCKL